MLKPVTVARDLGTTIELASGLSPTDRVIESPPDGVANGDPVRAAEPASKPGAAGARARTGMPATSRRRFPATLVVLLALAGCSQAPVLQVPTVPVVRQLQGGGRPGARRAGDAAALRCMVDRSMAMRNSTRSKGTHREQPRPRRGAGPLQGSQRIVPGDPRQPVPVIVDGAQCATRPAVGVEAAARAWTQFAERVQLRHARLRPWL